VADEVIDDRVLAVSRDSAASIAGLTRRQVDYWASTGLVAPTTDRRLSPARRVRLYSFVDLLALVVAAELRSRGTSLQHIRQIVAHLRSRGYDQPLTQLRFATLGNRVYFQHADGSWEGDVAADQLVIHDVLNLELVRRRIIDGVRRDRTLAGAVEQRRGTLGGKPVLAGTRIPVDTVRRYLEAGRPVSEVLLAFPSLTEADINAVRHTVA